MRRLLSFGGLVSVLIILTSVPGLSCFGASGPLVERLEIRDTVQPITAGRLERAIAIAERDHAAALLVDLDTPGGLLDSTRAMVGAILSSPVPVIVYIAPAGARGGSAGFFLLESADVAAMAPGTNAGASHPVLSAGVPDETMKAKMENDAAAFLRSYVGRHGRNAQAAEDAVRKSSSFSADEALAQHLIDLTATSDAELLAALDGRGIARVDAQGKTATVVLHLAGARVETIEPTVREQLLGYLANPNLALLLLVGGVMLIYLEFNAPGTVVPGALGTVMVLLAVFSLDMLPIRHIAVAMVLAAAVLMLMELKFASHGILAAAGIVCLAIGTLTLVDAPIPELGVQPVIAVGLCLGFGVITMVLLRLAMAARRSKALMGAAALVGAAATAMEPLWPARLEGFNRNAESDLVEETGLNPGLVGGQVGVDEAGHDGRGHDWIGHDWIGHILVQGEIWQAVANEPVAAKTVVRVTGFHGDILEVRPVVSGGQR